ncbi:MAG: spore cortex biosynthesis protein YabQ [Defluviitaleaceae bacterium]|nr:spore cortex biosynthesis protein YabQ [Defluviitaleaceae bacterium]
MILSMSGQAQLFLWTVLVGAVIGLFYDCFRILRRVVPLLALPFAVYLEDFIFWVAATGGTFYFMLNQNYGEIRVFSVLGAGLGAVLYFVTISRLVMLVFVTVIEYMKKVIAAALRIIFFPLRVLVSWLSPYLKKIYKKVRFVLRSVRMYGKIRLKKFLRALLIVRRKV